MARIAIVVGAGASVEFGLPTGLQLNEKVSAAVSLKTNEWGEIRWADDDVHEAFKSWPDIHVKAMYDASVVIGRAIAFHASPDDFLYAFGEDEAVVAAGKAAIATAILRCERSSWLAKLRDHEGEATDKLLLKHRTAWPLQLIGLRSPGLRVSEAGRLFEDLAIVNFNYDRCLEHLLYHALQRTHHLAPDDAAAVVNSMEIIHPYGQTGQLPWTTQTGAVGFGGTYAGRALYDLSTSIHTLTERHHSDEERERMRAALLDAERIVFLGFGFHQQNMELIARRPSLDDRDDPQVFATVFEASNSQRDVFVDRIQQAFDMQTRPQLLDRDCVAFLKDVGLKAFGS